jgi:hypothetical protein
MDIMLTYARSGLWMKSAIFEIRYDPEGEFYHLITAWKATQLEEQIHGENI